MIKDIVKSASWGALLLTLIILIAFGLTSFIHSTENFYSSEKLNQHKATLEAITPLIEEFDNNIKAEKQINLDNSINEFDPEDSINEFDPDEWLNERERELSNITNLASRIKEEIHKNCAECNLHFANKDYGKNLFQISLVDLSIKLKNKSNPDNARIANLINAFSLAMAAFLVISCLYLFLALIKYKSINSKGIAILFLLITPIILLSLSLMYVNYDNYLQIDLDLVPQGLILFAVLYMFIVYPVIFNVCKSKKLNIINILKLSN